MRFELVRERLEPLPRDLPEPPAVLTPIHLDAPAELGPPESLHSHRQAAVLVLLFPDGEEQARVLLTARVASLAAHAGEVSFPGGSADPDDENPVATALREAAEEVGLDPAACGLRVVGPLERVTVSVSGFRITPVVALAERRPLLEPAPGEVARVIEAPVEAFLPDAPVELEERVIRERLLRYGLYPVEGERVWGATARILGQLGALLAAGTTPGGAAEVALADGAPLPADEPRVRRATAADGPAVQTFLGTLGPDLARGLPFAAEVLLAEAGGRPVGLAAWAPWERGRPPAEPRGFEGVAFPDDPAELTLLAVAPALRGQGLGRRLAASIAETAGAAGRRRLVAWTLADSAVDVDTARARAFFRSNGFRDVAVDRRLRSGGEERLLLERLLQREGHLEGA